MIESFELFVIHRRAQEIRSSILHPPSVYLRSSTLISRATSSKTFSAWSMCSRVCVAISVMRNREVPAGTVGGRIPWANPLVATSSDNFMH